MITSPTQDVVVAQKQQSAHACIIKNLFLCHVAGRRRLKNRQFQFVLKSAEMPAVNEEKTSKKRWVSVL